MMAYKIHYYLRRRGILFSYFEDFTFCLLFYFVYFWIYFVYSVVKSIPIIWALTLLISVNKINSRISVWNSYWHVRLYFVTSDIIYIWFWFVCDGLNILKDIIMNALRHSPESGRSFLPHTHTHARPYPPKLSRGRRGQRAALTLLVVSEGGGGRVLAVTPSPRCGVV